MPQFHLDDATAKPETSLQGSPEDVYVFPTSFAQQRLWFLHQLDPDSPAYNIPLALRLAGRLDARALEQALAEIVRRHESLRTTFALIDGEPMQVINPAVKLTLPTVDLSHLPEGEREAEARRRAREQARRPFDLAEGPLVRAALLRLGAEEHVGLLTMHHIVSDGWSKGVFVGELAALYDAFSAGRPSPLEDLPVQYADYAVWQREYLSGEVLERQLAYWRGRLAGAPPALELPTDRPRPQLATYHGAAERFELPEGLSRSLKGLGRREGVTLFMTLLAAFYALLYRYSGQKEIVVGSPVAGRTRAETEGLIGFFVNTLALRADLSGDPTFRQLLGRVREVALGAYAHQDLPFEKLVEELQPARDLSRAPLFQVMFALQNAPAGAPELPGLRLSTMEVESGTAKFDLSLLVDETERGLVGTLEYNTDLFDAATVTRMANHFRTLLEGVVADPGQPVAGLPLLTEREQRQLLVEWNDTAAAHPTDKTLHALFEEQAERSPGRAALVFEGEQLTYRELNRRANCLAHHLRGLGVGPESLVAICAERSVEMVVGLLGILKSGAAYVPLDPTYPPKRLSEMLEDAKPAALLVQERLLTRLPPTATEPVCLDAGWEKIACESTENPAGGAGPGNLAYVIYTSGSTGRPKGVMNTHAAICNRLLWMQQAYGLTPEDRVLQKTPFSFDVSVWEFFWPLLAGARLVLARPGGHRDSAYLVEIIREQGITTLHFVPSMLRVWVEEEGLERCTSLRRVICSGEALPYDLQQRFFSRLNAGLHNLYGPTEAAVDVTYWECGRGSRPKVVPIGRPIANTQIYILDRHLRPVPVNVTGELHIGGAGLARGYLGRAALTAEKFIPDPFGAEAGERLYKTGDLARRLPDGEIEFIGRIDHQVKVRGHRIELGEVEAALVEHAGVRAAAAAVREDTPGEGRLVAYVVARGERPTPGELRGHLKERLPEYALPSVFMFLEALPLTPSGKVDRRALPSPDNVRAEPRESYVAPRDGLESRLARIWEEVLGVRPVGVSDNFFDLGGHSLLAVRLLARVQKAFKQSLPLVTFFQSPTVEALAGVLRRGARPRSRSPLVSIRPSGSRPPFYCIHPGGGHVLCYADLARRLGDDQPFYGLEARGLDADEEPLTRVEEMAAYYLKAVRGVERQGPYLLGGWSFGGLVAFEMARQLRGQGQEVALLALLDSRAPGSFGELPDFDDPTALALLARELGELFGQDVPASSDDLRRLGWGEQLEHALERAVSAGALPPDIGLPQLRRLLRVFKANLRAMRDYAPGIYPRRVTLFRARERLAGTDQDPAMGWGEFAAGGLEIYEVPGHHYTMVREPYVQALAERLRGCIDQALASDSGA